MGFPASFHDETIRAEMELVAHAVGKMTVQRLGCK